MFTRIFEDLVNQALNSSEYVGLESSVLSHILAAEGVDTRDKIVTLIDLVAAGIETVTSILNDEIIYYSEIIPFNFRLEMRSYFF